MAKWLIMIGAGIVLVGVVLQYAPWLISWFGKLPGDIRIEGENSFIYIPITSMIIISIALTLLSNLLSR